MGLPPYTHPVNSFDYDKYLSYLNSKKWAELKKERIALDDFKCAICGNPHNLEVHHLIYPAILGTEPIDHLITLCTHCHKEIENRKKYSTRTRAGDWIDDIEIWVKFKNIGDYEAHFEELEQFMNNKRKGHQVVAYLEDENAHKYVGGFGSERMTLVDYIKFRESYPERETKLKQ